MHIITHYSWPGNVRELENFIELGINKEKLPMELLEDEIVVPLIAHKEINNVSLETMEKKHIAHVLENEAYNITNAAKILGVGRNTLYRKLDKHRIDYDK